ncbi:MAG: hydroxymyristoyl-ACP dehydratase [Gammaproteobacteria bacterium]|nr:hydroxymyristoyl-ACP dehydratase [Gammaproteobacteria bacterium]
MIEQEKTFPTILDKVSSSDEVTFKLFIDPDIHWFVGHFPDEPILPGVVQVDWALHYAKEIGFSAASFAGFSRVKFKAVVRPEVELDLNIRRSSDNTYRFSFSSGAVLYSQGAVNCR